MSKLTADELLASVRSGRTLYIVNHAGAKKIDAKTVAKFDAVGHPVLKTGADGHLYMASGRNYVDCHYCAIRLV